MPFDKSVAPRPTSSFCDLDDTLVGSDLTLQPVITGTLFAETIKYGIIVEAWHKKDTFRGRRLWEVEFTVAEQNRLAHYNEQFYGWHLRSGTPLRVMCRTDTLALLQRAVNFFASI